MTVSKKDRIALSLAMTHEREENAREDNKIEKP